MRTRAQVPLRITDESELTVSFDGETEWRYRIISSANDEITVLDRTTSRGIVRLEKYEMADMLNASEWFKVEDR